MKRRSPLLLLVALTLLATACSSSSGNPDAAPREPSTSSSTTTTRLVLRPAAPYRPIAGEPVPELKQMAADALQAIAIYDVGGGTVEAVTRRLAGQPRSEEHTSELQSLMRNSYAVFCWNKKNKNN